MYFPLSNCGIFTRPRSGGSETFGGAPSRARLSATSPPPAPLTAWPVCQERGALRLGEGDRPPHRRRCRIRTGAYMVRSCCTSRYANRPYNRAAAHPARARLFRAVNKRRTSKPRRPWRSPRELNPLRVVGADAHIGPFFRAVPSAPYNRAPCPEAPGPSFRLSRIGRRLSGCQGGICPGARNDESPEWRSERDSNPRAHSCACFVSNEVPSPLGYRSVCWREKGLPLRLRIVAAASAMNVPELALSFRATMEPYQSRPRLPAVFPTPSRHFCHCEATAPLQSVFCFAAARFSFARSRLRRLISSRFSA